MTRGIIVGVIAYVVMMIGIVGMINDVHAQRGGIVGRCNAPCVVQFGAKMHEDQFCIDYRGNGTLRVWRDNDAECGR